MAKKPNVSEEGRWSERMDKLIKDRKGGKISEEVFAKGVREIQEEVRKKMDADPIFRKI